MGTYWNEGCYTLDPGSLLPSSPSTTPLGPLKFRKLVEFIDQPRPTENVCESSISSQQATISHVPRICVSTEDDFKKVLRAGKPVIIEGSNLGTCVYKWNAAYITENVGSQRKVSTEA
jgi:tRNA wybutosine-synthesizing protein 4